MTKNDFITIFKKRKDVPQGAKIIETIPASLKELMIIRNPKLKSASQNVIHEELKDFCEKNKNLETVFVYYPWQNTAVHMANENTYFELKTARNKNIINKEEQDLYRNAKVGIIGLSIGYNVITALVSTGGPKYLRIADFDTIDPTNLNRLPAPVFAIGMQKAEFAAKSILSLDPFMELDIWPQGAQKETIEKFILGPPKLDVFVDEMDSIDLKILARLVCKNHGVPVIMATTNGDNVILDVERFDQEPERKILHGLVENIEITQLDKMSYPEWLKVAQRIVGIANLTPRMRKCVEEIGKTLPAVPQLGTTASFGGGVVSYVIRKITMKQDMPSGRYNIGFLDSIDA